MVLDKIDKLILNTLQENGKTTNSKLSKMVGISAPATLERVKRLELSGVISHFTAVVECYQIAGANDFVLKVIAKDIKAYGEFMNKKLTQIEGIQIIKSSFVIDNVKEKKKFVLDPEEEYRV